MSDQPKDSIAALCAFVAGRAMKAESDVKSRIDAAEAWEQGTEEEHESARQLSERMSGRTIPFLNARQRKNVALKERRIAAQRADEAWKYRQILSVLEAASHG